MKMLLTILLGFNLLNANNMTINNDYNTDTGLFLNSQSALLLDYNSGEVIYEKNSNEKLHNLCSEVKTELEKIDTNDQTALAKLALDLSITANASTLIAKRILHYIELQNSLKDVNEE